VTIGSMSCMHPRPKDQRTSASSLRYAVLALRASNHDYTGDEYCQGGTRSTGHCLVVYKFDYYPAIRLPWTLNHRNLSPEIIDVPLKHQDAARVCAHEFHRSSPVLLVLYPLSPHPRCCSPFLHHQFMDCKNASPLRLGSIWLRGKGNANRETKNKLLCFGASGAFS